MPLVLKNAPTSFQRVINKALSHLCFTCVVAYIEDILVHLSAVASHTLDLVKIVAAIQAAGRHNNSSKCKFLKKEIPGSDKRYSQKATLFLKIEIEATINWATPSTQKEPRCFLEIVIFLKKFSLVFPILLLPFTPHW